MESNHRTIITGKYRKLKIIVIYILLSAIALMMLFPLLWMISTSLKSPSAENVLSFPPQLLPQQPTLENFGSILQQKVPACDLRNHSLVNTILCSSFVRYLGNSTLVAVLTVVLNLLFCSLAAYPLARLNFRGRDLIFAGVVSTIMIPFQIVMIPLYILSVQLGLKNSYLGIIFPSLASAFGIFLLRQAFRNVPKELEEAARMDGCSELGIWWHVMLPAIRPALVTLAIFVFIGSWSDFLWPLIILDRPEYYTLPLGVSKLEGTFGRNWRLISAGSVISIAPVLCLFLLLQRYIIPTDTGSGVKG